MPGYSAWNDDADDDRDWDRTHDASEDPVDEDESEPTMPCPGCGKEIYEEADACPYCGEYLADSDRQSPAKPWWVWLTVILLLTAMLGGVLIAAVQGFLH